MVYSGSKSDVASNPQTRCSNCQTVFEVSPELLASSDTRVRCGECLSIFDALEELRSAEHLGQKDSQRSAANVAATGGTANLADDNTLSHNETAALDVTYSDFDIFTEDADLPEIAYFDQTRDTPDFDFDSVEMGNDETFNDILFVHDVTIDADATSLQDKPLDGEVKSGSGYAEVDFVADDQPREPLIFNYRDAVEPVAAEEKQVDSEGFNAEPVDESTHATAESALTLDDGEQAAALEASTGSSPWFFRFGMLLLLGVLLGSLFFYRTRPQLYNNPTWRPMLEAGCNIMRCTLPARVDVASLKMIKRNVYSHPSTPNALVVNVSFRNDADFDQQLPVLQMVLTNRIGRTVAKEDFSPTSYMPNWKEGAVIEANQQLDVKLEVDDPGQDAQSFEFHFREFKS